MENPMQSHIPQETLLRRKHYEQLPLDPLKPRIRDVVALALFALAIPIVLFGTVPFIGMLARLWRGF